MKAFVIAISLAVALISVVHAEQKTLADLFRIEDAVGYLFVKEVAISDEGEFGYELTKHNGETKGALGEALESAAAQICSPDRSYPLIGILARMMLLDSEGDPVCSMEVVNWNRTIVFKGVDATGGQNRIEDPRVVVRSDLLCRWVYEEVRKNNPEQFKAMQENYRRVGENLESLLFPDPTTSE